MLLVSGIKKSYKKNIVLDGISFTAESGDYIGIVGRNGSGKSTLLSIISAILPPDEGDIIINGTSILKSHDFAKKSIGFIPQDDCVFSDLSVADNIKFWASAYNVKLNTLWDSGSIADILGLKDFKNKRVSQLSGGMRRRVSIAASIVHSPDYLILDEPCSGLDVFYKNEIIKFLKLLKNMGKTIIYTSHDSSEITSLCNKVYEIENKKLLVIT